MGERTNEKERGKMVGADNDTSNSDRVSGGRGQANFAMTASACDGDVSIWDEYVSLPFVGRHQKHLTCNTEKKPLM